MDYYSWLIRQLNISSDCNYTKLLKKLFDTDFIYIMDRDQNRAEDGVELRQRYCETTGYGLSMNRPCSVLELMISCAMHVEAFMNSADYKDRTNVWFWEMITSLGLRSYNDIRYDELEVTTILMRFMNRNYEPNGRGGLFTVINPEEDMRSVEIWYQLCWHVNEIMPALSF